jgi:hypothetical protein
MRRSFVAIAVLAAVGLLAARPWAGDARALQAPTASTQAGTCALTSFTLSGPFTRLGGTTTFALGFGGGCVGTSSSVAGNITFTSVGPWSCLAGAAVGSGGFQVSNGAPEVVGASLVNAGGEYAIEMHAPALTAAAVGNITTLPTPCAAGQTQTTIGGTGTLTYGATA